MKTRLIVSCEHGGNRVPNQYRSLFRDSHHLLSTHRGFDPGSLALGRTLARRFQAPLYAATVTRLLVELNRSTSHPRLFSEFTCQLDKAHKQQILDRYYFPHRNRVEESIAANMARGQFVLHVGVHTFTPQLDGHVRSADIGLLYDPGRGHERRICRQWRERLLELRGHLRVRRNYPYRGKADGFTTYLRKRFDAHQYAGIELEVNQQWLHRGDEWKRLVSDIVQSLAVLVPSR